MASGISSGRASVSPVNDEVYQSPGASQDDGIDQMMAQYSGLVGRRRGEGGEEEGERGGRRREARDKGERGMQRSRLQNASERSSAAADQANSHHPPHSTVTPSPHHTGPAPHDNLPPGHTGQTGLAGDVRSLSWDDVAAATIATGAKSEYPTRMCTCVGACVCVVIPWILPYWSGFPLISTP